MRKIAAQRAKLRRRQENLKLLMPATPPGRVQSESPAVIVGIRSHGREIGRLTRCGRCSLT